MTTTVIGLARFGVSLLFGLAVSALFAGIDDAKKSKWSLAGFCIVFLVIQTVSWRFWGLELTAKLYPLMIHLPIILIFTLYYKRPLLLSIVSVLTGYLCCQAPRFIGYAAAAVIGHRIADHIFYVAAVILAYYYLQKYVAPSIRDLTSRSNRSTLLLGGVPLFYYLFDYFTTVYTHILYNGAEWAVQFMPSIVSVFYFVFVLLYYVETQKQFELQRERDLLDVQLRQAHSEFATLRQLHQNAAAYRHDMRHHFALLQGLANRGRLEEIREYLQTTLSDIDAFTPLRFCENETVNVILSFFDARAKRADTELEVEAVLPDELYTSDTELCSLLCNALENALYAAEAIPEAANRRIRLRLHIRNTKLCVEIRNTYQNEPEFRDDMPVTSKTEHGIGTKSMVHIVEKYGGVYKFATKDGWFIFQATL